MTNAKPAGPAAPKKPAEAAAKPARGDAGKAKPPAGAESPARPSATARSAPPPRSASKAAPADKTPAGSAQKPPAKTAAKPALTPKPTPKPTPRPSAPQTSAAPPTTLGGGPLSGGRGPGGGKGKHLKLPPAGRRIGSENLLWAAVSFSLVLHALALAAHFKFANLVPTRQVDKGLEVVLVNARHARSPQDPQVLAQSNLDGGGDTKQKVLPTTPVPPQDAAREGESLIDMKRRVEQLEARQRELLKQSQALRMAQVESANPDQTDPTERALGEDLLETARAIARQEALIAKQQQEYAERPRKAFVGARAKEYRFAQYVEDWRHKIERVGTLNFPLGPEGKKLYGSLMITVEVRHDGSVVGAEIKRSSGNKALDAHALRVLQLAAPFAAFPPNIRRDTDVIVISRTWNFSTSDTLDATRGAN